MSIKTPLNQLIKYAAYGGIFIGSSGLLMRWMILQKLRKSEYYKLSVSNFLAHKPLVDYMGEPVGFGSVDLGSRENFSTETQAKFTVPLKGSKQTGNLFFEASRNPQDEKPRWKLDKLEVTVDDRPLDKVIVPIKYPVYDYNSVGTSNLTLPQESVPEAS